MSVSSGIEGLEGTASLGKGEVVDVVKYGCEGKGTPRESGTEANSKGER